MTRQVANRSARIIAGPPLDSGGLPEAGERHRGESVSEGHGAVPGVGDDATGEAIPEPIGEEPQAPEVVGSSGGRCLDLDAGNLALARFEHEIDLRPAS